MGASDTYPAGSTGGSATHTQTEDEMATHNHWIKLANDSSGSLSVPSNEWRLVYKDPGMPTNYLMEHSGKNVGMQDSGNGKPMDILNPYYSMYIWRRVA